MREVEMHKLMAGVRDALDTWTIDSSLSEPVIEKLLTALEELYVAIDEAYPPSSRQASHIEACCAAKLVAQIEAALHPLVNDLTDQGKYDLMYGNTAKRKEN